MAKHVGRHCFPFEGGTSSHCGVAVASNQSFDSIPTQRSAATAGEDRRFGIIGALAEPWDEEPHRLLAKRGAALLSSLPLALHVSSASKPDVLASQADKFRDPQSRLDGDQQEDLVPPADPGGRIRRRNQRIDLLTRERP